MSYMHMLLELILEMHYTIWEAFLLLPLLVGVRLRTLHMHCGFGLPALGLA
jgi:hypothetical protein